MSYTVHVPWKQDWHRYFSVSTLMFSYVIGVSALRSLDSLETVAPLIFLRQRHFKIFAKVLIHAQVVCTLF